MSNDVFERYNGLLEKLSEFAKNNQDCEETRLLLVELYAAYPVSAAIDLDAEMGSYALSDSELKLINKELDSLEQSIKLLCEKEPHHVRAFRHLQRTMEKADIEVVNITPEERIREVVAMDRLAVHVGEEVSLGSGLALVDADAHYYSSPDEVHNILNHMRLLRDDVASLKRLGLLGEGMVIPVEGVHRARLSLVQSYLTGNYPKLLERIETQLWQHREDGSRVTPLWQNISRLEQAGFIFTNNRDPKVLDLHIEGLIVQL